MARRIQDIRKDMKGRMQITLPTGGRYDEEECFNLRIEDSSSGVLVLEANIPVKALALMLAGRAGQEIKYDLFDVYERVGLVQESKTEFVPGELKSYKPEDRKIEGKAAVAPFEVDGWTGDWNNFGNGHKVATKDGVKGYNLHFWRLVDPDTGEPFFPKS